MWSELPREHREAIKLKSIFCLVLLGVLLYVGFDSPEEQRVIELPDPDVKVEAPAPPSLTIVEDKYYLRLRI